MKRFSLVGVDGNAYSVMGYVTRAMRSALEVAKTEEDKKLFNKEAQNEYVKKAQSSDYSNLLCVSMDQVEKVNDWLEKNGLIEEDDEDDFYDEDDDDYDDFYEEAE